MTTHLTRCEWCARPVRDRALLCRRCEELQVWTIATPCPMPHAVPPPMYPGKPGLKSKARIRGEKR